MADSPTTGYGVCYRTCNPAEAAQAAVIGRQAEKWHFEVASCISARAHALGIAAAEGLLELGPPTMGVLAPPGLDPPESRYQAFREVPAQLLADKEWRVA